MVYVDILTMLFLTQLFGYFTAHDTPVFFPGAAVL